VILQDIRRGIVESDVIVAEITPVNANVFYELGCAHALDTPTILLANRNVDKRIAFICCRTNVESGRGGNGGR
jgi:nucleoside 2-deoxyribosyltransferase